MREVRIGNCIELLREMDPESVQCVVTSPPYWGLRSYAGQQEVIWTRVGSEDPGCDHTWGPANPPLKPRAVPDSTSPGYDDCAAKRSPTGRFCLRCGAWRGAFGLEPTPQLYVEHTSQVLREIRRVLRPDGLVWWNIGDCYAGSGGAHAEHHANPGISKSWQRDGVPHWGERGEPGRYLAPRGLKQKDLVMIPFRVALATQGFAVVSAAEILSAADMLAEARAKGDWHLVEMVEGLLRRWAFACLIAPETEWVRSVVIWEKPNAMPESVRDRPTESHEYILLLSRSERYFYDADAVREPHLTAGDGSAHAFGPKADATQGNAHSFHPAGRNLRSVWRFATIPYPGAHFAVFPPELPRRCILAGTPPKVCATCGAPWQRLTQREIDNTGYPNGPGGNYVDKGHPPGGQERDESGTLGKVARYRVTTTGWHPGCQCWGMPETITVPCPDCEGTGRKFVYPQAGPNTAENNGEPWQHNNPHLARLQKQPTDDLCATCDGSGEQTISRWPDEMLARWPTRPALVLDPFAGSGTTLRVAEDLGRWWIGFDISAEYRSQIERRTAQRSLAAAFENPE
jgi:DNA modification methylase